MTNGSTAAVVEAAFRQYGAMTIAEAAARTGIHPARIRHVVQSPAYRRVHCEWATRRWAWTWTLTGQNGGGHE